MIYLDHAAATPLSPRALAAMKPYFSEHFFNPSSPYWPAKEVQAAYRAAKDTIAHAIGAKAVDLVMTSGATEANALAVTAVSSDSEILLAATEHASVRQAVQHSAGHPAQDQSVRNRSAQSQSAHKQPAAQPAEAQPTQNRLQKVQVHPSGLLDLADLKAKITAKTELISVALADNELGTIQPLAEIAQIVRAERQRRLQRGDHRPLWLHSDASQALNLMSVNVARLGVDLLTLNAAKAYGPKGVGALYLGHQVKIQPLFVGGGQERGLRGGTENVPGVIGFAAALQEAQTHLNSNRKKYTEFSTLFRQELTKACDQQLAEPHLQHPTFANHSGRSLPASSWPLFLGSPKHQLVNFCPVSFPGLDAERLVFKLDEEGILLSTGAACAASKGQKSHVLQAIGLDETTIAGSLRISFGVTNTRADVITAAHRIAEAACDELRRLAHHNQDLSAPN